MHLLDTDVVWALRSTSDGDGSIAALAEWASGLVPSTLFLSVVTLLDFEAAIGRLERKEKATAAAVRGWLDGRLRPAFAGRILPIDDPVASRWARLNYSETRDGLLAATALEHGLTLATGTPAAYRQGRVRTCNPWTYAPDASEMDWRQASQRTPVWLKSLFVRA